VRRQKCLPRASLEVVEPPAVHRSQGTRGGFGCTCNQPDAISYRLPVVAESVVEELLADLVAEHDELDEIVSRLSAESWDLPTPAEDWSVRDQLSHLAFFDEAASWALDEPGRFAQTARALLDTGPDPMEAHLRRGRELDPPELLSWWRSARAALVHSARSRPGDSRVPWFGPDMSLRSFVSARLMETWAHGQDVADALHIVRRPTDRLRHVAHIGVRTRNFSYVLRGLEVPEEPVRVELVAPSGESWVWDESPAGPDGRAARDSSVSGTALDFCLVVTQRRHLGDTRLRASGAPAREWLEIAQAFAGPPGGGRRPGQFSS